MCDSPRRRGWGNGLRDSPSGDRQDKGGIVKNTKLTAWRPVIAALSAAGMLWAGVSFAQQQPQPAPRGEDRPLPRKADLPDLGEPPADFGAGAAAIRNEVTKDAVAQADPDEFRRANPLVQVDPKANPNDV